MEEDKHIHIYRANGNTICQLCGKIYYNHPMDETILDFNNEPYLNVLCNGDRVKL